MTLAASTRTTRKTHVFGAAFRVGEDEEVFPAGAYDILMREAVHEGNERTVYVRISTMLLVKSMGTTRHCEVRPVALEEAIRLDATAIPQAPGEVR